MKTRLLEPKNIGDRTRSYETAEKVLPIILRVYDTLNPYEQIIILKKYFDNEYSYSNEEIYSDLGLPKYKYAVIKRLAIKQFTEKVQLGIARVLN